MLSNYSKEQPIVHKILKNSIKKNNISHAYLFVSNQYSKTMDFAIEFAKELILKTVSDNNDVQNIINMIDNKVYGDLQIIDPDGMWIKKEEIINLQNEFSNKSMLGTRRVYIINNAHKLNISSSNALLKFLEEPEDDIVAILITDNKYQLLDTIISRCVNINFRNYQITDDNQNITMKEKIANNILNDKDEKMEFIENIETDNLITNVIDFIKFYEMNKLNSILYINKIWHEKIKNKIQTEISFDIMIMFYKDMLNHKINRNIDIFNDNVKEIEKMCENNTIDDLVRKINTIIEIKIKLKNNVNSKLLMDKLIIKLGGEGND